MKIATLEAISAMLKTDETITPAERVGIVARLRRKKESASQQPARGSEIIRRHQVAEMLSCCLRTVDNLDAQGILRKVKFPGRVRGCGFRRADVEALIGGDYT